MNIHSSMQGRDWQLARWHDEPFQGLYTRFVKNEAEDPDPMDSFGYRDPVKAQILFLQETREGRPLEYLAVLDDLLEAAKRSASPPDFIRSALNVLDSDLPDPVTWLARTREVLVDTLASSPAIEGDYAHYGGVIMTGPNRGWRVAALERWPQLRWLFAPEVGLEGVALDPVYVGFAFLEASWSEGSLPGTAELLANLEHEAIRNAWTQQEILLQLRIRAYQPASALEYVQWLHRTAVHTLETARILEVAPG